MYGKSGVLYLPVGLVHRLSLARPELFQNQHSVDALTEIYRLFAESALGQFALAKTLFEPDLAMEQYAKTQIPTGW